MNDVTDALAESYRRHPQDPRPARIEWAGVNLANPVYSDAWEACDHCGGLARYGATANGAASHHDTKRRWCEACYHAEAEAERADADDFTNAVADPAPTVTRVYGGPND